MMQRAKRNDAFIRAAEPPHAVGIAGDMVDGGRRTAFRDAAPLGRDTIHVPLLAALAAFFRLRRGVLRFSISEGHVVIEVVVKARNVALAAFRQIIFALDNLILDLLLKPLWKLVE